MDFTQIDTPALLIDRDKVISNIQLAISYAGSVDRLRPHVKTHKTLEVAQLQVAAGIYKFKCATIPEAEMLGLAGAREVLLAYPIQGPKIGRFIKLMQRFTKTKFAALVDNYASAREINIAAEAAALTIGVFIDLNVGQGRTGILVENAPALVKALKDLTDLELLGLHAYDGHLHMPSLAERTLACRAAFNPVTQLRKTLEQRYQRDFVVIAGGSPTFRIHAEHHDVECSPGTFIFWDEGYGHHYPEQEFKKAAVLATRVISKPNAYTYCLDLGHKSVASEMPFPRVALQSALPLQQIGHSEEHLVVRSEEPDVLTPGEVLLAFPYHICPTVALYDHVLVISNNEQVGRWRVIARDRKITL